MYNKNLGNESNSIRHSARHECARLREAWGHQRREESLRGYLCES